MQFIYLLGTVVAKEKSGKDDHMNRKLNAAITAGLSLSMVLGSTPVSAIAAEVNTQSNSDNNSQVATQSVTTILFVANGGSFSGGEPTFTGYTNDSGVVAQPETPTMEGKVFAGWSYSSQGGSVVDLSKPLSTSLGYVKLFATWTDAAQTTVDVNFHANNGKFADGGNEQYGVTDSKGYIHQPAAPTRDGYVFAGWTFDKAGTKSVDFSQPVSAKSGSVDLYAQWTKAKEDKTKDIMYVANGGQFADGNTFQQGVTDTDGVARQPAAPSRDGYTFAGWTYDKDGKQPVDFTQAIPGGGKSATFYAQWTKNKDNAIDIMYVANGGVFADGNNFQQGVTDSKGVARKPVAPTRDGYEFTGWTYDQAGTQPVDFDNPIVAGSGKATFFAQWKEAKKDNAIDIMYSANGGVFADGNDFQQGVTDGNGYARKPWAPTRDGYEFTGWTYDKDGKSPVDFDNPIVAGSGKATFFAQWKKVEKDNVIEVQYVGNGGKFFDGNDTNQGVTDSKGIARQPLAPTREGYTFAGWTYDKEGKNAVDFSKPLVAGSGHATLFAQWTKNKTNVKNVMYYANGGTFVDGQEIWYGVTDSKGVARKPAEPKRSGYVFTGWTYDAEGTQPVDFDNPIPGGGENATFYAQWKEAEKDNSIEIMYVANGGKFFDGNDTMQGVTDSKGIARKPFAPTRDGYEFTGWTYDAAGTQSVDFNNPVVAGSGHATFFAQWKEVKKDNAIDVLYVANGGQFVDGNDTMQGVTDGKGIARKPVAPTRDGYEFAGWTYDSTGKNDVDFDKPLVAGSGHATLFAKWTKKKSDNVIDVLYVANGGLFADGNTTQQGVTDSKGIARKPAAPTREGYTFNGWTYDAEGTQPVDFDNPVIAGSGHATFFAQWTKNEDPAVKTHKVTFFVDGSTTTAEVEDGKAVAQPDDPSVKGFSFIGWSTSKDNYEAYDFSTPVTDDITLYAFFKAEPAKSDTQKGTQDGAKKTASDAKKSTEAKKADAKKDSALPTTGDPVFVVGSAAALTGAVAMAVGMYMTKRREH